MTAATSNVSSQYNASINGLRGLCVALVFLFHVTNSGLPPLPSPDAAWQQAVFYFFTTMRYGVEIFFMISGYVIVMSLRRHATVSAFFKDRALRIFPVWVPVLMSICLTGPFLGYPIFKNIDLWDWLGIVVANLFLLPPLLPFPEAHTASWSLSYEWLFYIVSAVGLLAFRARAGRSLWIAAWSVVVLVALACFPRALFFVPGVLIALYPGFRERASRWPVLSLVSLVIFLLAWRHVNVWDVRYQAETTIWALFAKGQGWALIVALLCATHFFACVVQQASRQFAMLRTPVLQQLGNISYSFYLWHPLVMFAVKKILLSVTGVVERGWVITLSFTVLSAVISWALSYVSWRLFEVALARWLKGGAHRYPRPLAAGS